MWTCPGPQRVFDPEDLVLCLSLQHVSRRICVAVTWFSVMCQRVLLLCHVLLFKEYLQYYVVNEITVIQQRTRAA